MYPVLFSLDLPNGLHVTMSSYRFMGALTFSAWIYLASAAAQREGISPYRVLFCAFFSVGFGFLGARLVHEGLTGNWSAMIDARSLIKGALNSTGGILSGAASLPLLCLLMRLQPRETADLLAPHIPLAHSIARLGCLLTGCCAGKTAQYPWGLLFFHPNVRRYPYGVLKCPTQIYSSLGNLAIFFILSMVYRRRGRPGQVACLYVSLYGLMRFLIQPLREGDFSPPIISRFMDNAFTSCSATATSPTC